MVVGPGDHGLQADIIFVVEGTAISGAYLNDMKTNYVIPTLEYFSHGTIEERDYVAESTSTQYGLVVYQAADCLPNPSSNCYGPYSSPQRLLNVLDKIELVGGKGESHANIAEGLATALQCFEDLQQRREPNILPQKHCILVCNSPPYLLPVMESPAFSGHTVEQLAALLQERGIHLSVLSPRKIPALFKLYEKAGGDLQMSQTKNYAKDPRHLVLLKGYSLKERPISPTPGIMGAHISSLGSIPSLPSPVANIGSPQQPQQVAPTSTATSNFRPNQQNPPPMMPNQQQQPQQPQQQPQQQPNLTTNLVLRGFPQNTTGYPRHPSRWPMLPPQPRAPYMPQNNQTSSALIAQLTQPPPTIGSGVNQATLNNPFGSRMDNNVIMSTQPSMNSQPMRLPVSGLMTQQSGAPSGPVMNPTNMVVPGTVAQGPGQQGPPQSQQNPTGPGPGQSVQPGSQQPQSVNQPQGAAPGPAGQTSQVPGQAPPGGTQPQQQQQPQQPGTVRERHTIWQGVLEWIEKAKNPNEPQKLTRHVPCQVSASPKDGEPDLKADSWPQKLIMQLMPKQLIGNIGGAYLKNSKSVLFHPQQCEALESLTKVMSSGFAGCVHFTSMPSPSPCDIKVLILLYTSEKRAYLGFIPNDQTAFVDRLRKVIQHQKTTQALIRQQGQVGNPGGNPPGAGGPQQPQLGGPMTGPAGGPQGNQQQNNPQQGPQGGILMSQTNQLALGGGQITQNVVTSAGQQMQQVPLGQPGGGSGTNQPSPAQMQGLQNTERHLGAPGANQQQQQQPGGGGPLRGQGMMGGPPQRPPFDHIEVARQQNLAKIQQLRQTLEAAQQQELQYKSQLEIMNHMKIQQLQQNLEHAQQQEVQYKAQMEEQQKQPRAQLQQQLFQQQQQQQQQRQMNPQNMQPNQQQQQPNQQQQQRLIRPGIPNNPGLRHLLQQQPQFRQQVLNTMQLNGPRGQQNPGGQSQPPLQFEDSFDFVN